MSDGLNLAEALASVAAGVSISLAGFWAVHAYRTGRLRSGWLRLRVKALGGVTTLEQTLSYNCAMCHYSLDADETVRKLSCGHDFHYHGTTCKDAIDACLREECMACPVCHKTALPVWPWNARPPLSPPPAPAPAASSSVSASRSASHLVQSPSGSSGELPLSWLVLE